jgi:uncharacterized protein YjdB
MSSGQDYLYLNGNGFYVYNPTDLSAKRTKFQRKIIITPVTDVDAIALPFPPYHIIKVTVQVSWDRKATVLSSGVLASTCGPTNCITTEGTLYNWYNTAISVVSITINDPTKNNTSLHVGDSYQLTDTINPTNATNKSISWSSDNPAVISVDNTGLVAAVGPGTANIYAVTADGSKKDTDFFQVVNK